MYNIKIGSVVGLGKLLLFFADVESTFLLICFGKISPRTKNIEKLLEDVNKHS
jgi:hypothetical protein